MVDAYDPPIPCPACGVRLRYVGDEPRTKRLLCWPGGCRAEFEIEWCTDFKHGLLHRTLHRMKDGVRTGKVIALEPIRFGGD